jgi:hypothetical protein
VYYFSGISGEGYKFYFKNGFEHFKYAPGAGHREIEVFGKVFRRQNSGIH